MAGKLPIAKEGWPFIAIPGAVALGLALLGHRRLAVPFAAAAAASAGFFRDPERAIPMVANGVLSPADGKVISVEDAVDPFVGPSVRVAIFLSPLDVHVNRSPIAGLVKNVEYAPGRFVAAYRPEASEENERCTVSLEGETRVAVKQNWMTAEKYSPRAPSSRRRIRRAAPSRSRKAQTCRSSTACSRSSTPG